MRAHRLLIAFLLSFWAASASAAFDPSAMRLKYVQGATYHTMGWTGAEARDVDGIPGDELLIGYTNMWQILRWNPASQDFAQVGFYENSYGDVFGAGGGLVSVHFAMFERSAPYQVAVLGDDGYVGRFSIDGSLSAPFWKPAISGEITNMLIENVDDQPGDEVLLQTATELTAWKFGAATPLWRIPVQSSDRVLVAQLDTDPQPELVLSSGTVYDTKTMQIQWRYPLGFGAGIISGDLDGDGVAELIGCSGRQCDAFDVQHQTTLWETFLPYPDEAGAIAVADVDFDGRAELFEGDAQHGFIRKIDGRTGEVVQSFAKTGGANFVLIANLQGNCSRQLVWAKDGDNTALDTFHVTDAITMETFWSSVPEERGASGIAVADFSGTGHPSILWSSQGGTIERFVSFNPPARSYKRWTDRSDGSAFSLSVSAAAQLDSDPAVEYVLPYVADVLGGSIGVYDGATHRLEWSLPVVPSSDVITAITTSDLNGDGRSDILVASSIDYFPRSHNEAIVAVDGATRKILWSTKEQLSHLLSLDCDGCVFQVSAADLDGDGAKEVLALVPSEGLFAFNGKTGDLLWLRLLGGPEDNTTVKAYAFTVADIDPSPGLEIIVAAAGGRLLVFDKTGANLIRSTDLGTNGIGSAVAVADLDGDGAKEIVVLASGGLMVLSADKLDVLWSGGFVLPGYSLGNQIAIADVDGDGTPEIVVSSAHSLRVFEYRSTPVDVVPPLLTHGPIHVSGATDCCSIELDWPAASDSASMPVTYRVYRSLSPGAPLDASSRVAVTAGTSFVDRNLLRGHTFYYAVTAVDSAGNETTDALRISTVGPASCITKRRAAGK
jgi:hypothetical protein